MARSHDKIIFGVNEEHERVLRATTITPDHPGPILRDFQTYLDFVGPSGLAAGGQHQLLPINVLATLNQHMSWPIQVDLERPQLRSYPNLQGMHLLSRASGLVVVQGHGSKARLVVDPELLASWTSLNPTEQYFSLLDVWLVHGRREMVGQRAGFDDSFIDYAAGVWTNIPMSGQRYSASERAATNARIYPDPDRYTMVLMSMFGLLEIAQGSAISRCAWIPSCIRHRPFGEAMFAALSPKVRVFQSMRYVAEEVAEEMSGGKKKGFDSESVEDEDDADAADSQPSDDGRFNFNSFHSIFAPYFPALQHCLSAQLEEAGDGLFIFRVSLRSMWRRIAAPARATLEDLARAIIDSVDFDDDHLWTFRLKSRFGSRFEIRHPEMDFDTSGDDMRADDIQVGQLPIAPGDAMIFVFDFGDNWEFKVLLEKIDAPAGKQRKPKVIEKHGKSPEQYPDWDE